MQKPRLVAALAIVATLAFYRACSTPSSPDAPPPPPPAAAAVDAGASASAGDILCVYNKSDGKLIGALVSRAKAPDGVNEIATVLVDPELDPTGGIAPGTTWTITVPKNGVIRPCKTD